MTTSYHLDDVRNHCANFKAVKETPLEKAEKIIEQYKQLEYCCGVIKDVKGEYYDRPYPMVYGGDGGWKLSRHKLENAGIDVEDIYDYMEKLAKKKKAEIEAEISKLEL